MMFLLGFSTGITVAGIIVTVMVYFRSLIEAKVMVVERAIESAGPRPKGFITMPDDDATAFRNEVIEKNKQEGKDTKLSDLL